MLSRHCVSTVAASSQFSSQGRNCTLCLQQSQFQCHIRTGRQNSRFTTSSSSSGGVCSRVQLGRDATSNPLPGSSSNSRRSSRSKPGPRTRKSWSRSGISATSKKGTKTSGSPAWRLQMVLNAFQICKRGILLC